MKNLSVIVPCYNYENKILNNIKKIISKLKNHNINYEIIIVNDGSSDNTKNKIETILTNKRIYLINNKKNSGKSFSIICALSKCKFDNVLLIDCDLPYFDYFDKFLYEIYNDFDIICVNRRSKKSRLTNKSLSIYQTIRFKLGNFIGKLINIFLKIDLEGTDTQAGLKAFKKDEKFNKLNFFSKKYFFDLELIFYYIKNKKKILSVPVKYEMSSKSNIRLFSLKNFYILYEFFKVILILKYFS